MFCQQCGAIVPEGTTFCEECSRGIPPAPVDANGWRQGQETPAPGDTNGWRQGQEATAPGDTHAAPYQGQQAPQNRQPYPPPSVSEYLGGQSQGPRYVSQQAPPTASRRRARNPMVAMGLSWGAFALGLLVLVTTFGPWMNRFEYWQKPSGWTFMVNGGQVGGNFVWIKAPGLLYFSGVWSILAGLAIMTGAAMLLLDIRAGRYVAGIGGIAGLGAATVNIVITLRYSAGVGYGLWLFALFAALAVVGIELSCRYS